MLRMLTSAFNLIGILGTWGFMAYGGVHVPWYLKPIAVVWAVLPFFALNLIARRWQRLRAKAVLLLAAALTCTTTLQGNYAAFIGRPASDAPFFPLIMPVFQFVMLIPFLVAGFVFEHARDDD